MQKGGSSNRELKIESLGSLQASINQSFSSYQLQDGFWNAGSNLIFEGEASPYDIRYDKNRTQNYNLQHHQLPLKQIILNQNATINYNHPFARPKLHLYKKGASRRIKTSSAARNIQLINSDNLTSLGNAVPYNNFTNA